MKKKLIVLLGAIVFLVACNKNVETEKETVQETVKETIQETQKETETETEKETEKETVQETEKETQSETDFENPIPDQFTIDDFENKEDYIIYKLKPITNIKNLSVLATGNEININGILAEEYQVYEDNSGHIVTHGYYAVDNAGVIYENDIITNQWIEIE